MLDSSRTDTPTAVTVAVIDADEIPRRSLRQALERAGHPAAERDPANLGGADVLFLGVSARPEEAVEMLKDLTTDRQKIEDGLEELSPGSGTSFYDSLLLTIDEVCERYGLTLEEFAGWQRAVDRSGMQGLRVTRIQHYRDLYELWARGKYFPILFSRPKVESVAEKTIQLTPQ